MRIAVIGGGFTGLTAAYKLAKQGHRVTVFEKDKVLGGLAHGFKKPDWEWHLEYAYHHLFANDNAILSLIKELGLEDKLILTRPITANFITDEPRTGDRSEIEGAGRHTFSKPRHGLGTKDCLNTSKVWTLTGREPRYADLSAGNERIVQLDSPLHLLRYPNLSPLDKLRTAALLAFCKANPFWQPLEGVTAKQLFETIGGKQAWQALWEPLMIGKFGDLADTVAASWLAARIKKRTPKLYYIEGGFHTVVEALKKAIKQQGGIIQTNVTLSSVTQPNNKKICFYISGRKSNNKSFSSSSFSAVLLTVPTPIATKLIPKVLHLTSHILPSLPIPHLHAQTLILETKEPILKKAYWLNITDRSFPFLAVVAHTNMVDKKHYGGNHLTYFGNYLPEKHRYLKMTKEQLLKKFLPFIKRLNPSFRQLSIVNCQLFTGWYAQPVHQLHYSKIAPKLETGIPGVYLANLDSIYPWDRGTNYAVELGIRAARFIIEYRIGTNIRI